MVNNPLEFLAARYDNVVKYDGDGNPSIFVKFPKMKSSELVAGLPQHTHPAFIIDGIEQDYILLGKYKGGENGVSNDALLSLPNIMPARSQGADEMLARLKLAGEGITGMTVADYGFIKLLAQKNGWTPHGNTQWGQSHIDGTAWATGQSIALNAVKAFEGYLYTCIQAHTSAAELKPDIAPAYWRRGKRIGGTSKDTGKDATHQTGYRTLNGSGPIDWYLGEDVGSLADIIGSSMEQQYGYRIVDCELQILPDNNAADPEADLSESSRAWRAILPNASNDGYALVQPGTAGTLHWNWLNNKITLDTVCDDFTLGQKSTSFANLAVNTTHLPYVPSIVKELGLFPTGSGDSTPGNYYINFATGEFFPRRGGYYSSGSYAGLGCVYANYARGLASPYYGCRPRSLAGPLTPES